MNKGRAKWSIRSIFNGSDDYVGATTPSVPIGNGSYAIEVWTKADTMVADGIVGWGNYGTADQVNALRLTGDITSEWHHVAATYDGTTRCIFLDGALAGSDNPIGHAGPDSSNFSICSTNFTEYFNGQIDEVRIWSTSRSGTQIKANMNRTLSGSETGLVAYY